MDPSGQSSKNKKKKDNNNPSSSQPISLPESSNFRSLNTTFDPSNELVWTPYTEPVNLSWLNIPPFENERFGDFDPRRDHQHIIVDQSQSSEQEVPHHHNINTEVPDEGASSKDKGLMESDQQHKRTEQTPNPINLTSSVPSSNPANASNKNVNDDDSKLKSPAASAAAAPLQDTVEEEEEEQMVPPLHIRELAYTLQNMYRYHGVEEDELDGVLLENPFGYEKLRDDHMPYLKKFETVQKERAAAAAAEAAAAAFGRRHYHYSGPHAQTPYPYQARERDPDYLPSSSRDSKRTVRIKRTINPADPSQPPVITFQRNRKKPGCACSKSRCVKNLCGCVVLETGCNAKCRCTDCENPFGRKPGKVPKGRPPKLIIKRGINLK